MSMVQYGLWPNCTNNCDFCLLLDRNYKSKKERLHILRLVKQNIKAVDWKNQFSDGISLLGGEIFYTEHKEIKESFLDLITLIIDYIFTQSKTAMLSVVSNGIYDPNVLLVPVLDLLKEKKCLDRLDLNFSYDLKYRFHNEKARLQAISTINFVYDKYGIKPNVQTCLTQYLIDMHLNGEFNIFDFQEQTFPHSFLTFLYPHKINTGKTLNDFFFTRDSFIRFVRWMKSHGYNTALESFIQSVINSSQFKYTGLWNRTYIERWDDERNRTMIEQAPTLEKKQILTECGHSQLYRCYSDCDNCMLCDLQKIL